jgi:hypothetical protein
MSHPTRTIHVEPGSEIDRLLDEASDGPIELVRNGTRFRLDQAPVSAAPDDIWAGYNPDVAIAGMEAAFGSWADVDVDALKDQLRRARDEGSRPITRP